MDRTGPQPSDEDLEPLSDVAQVDASTMVEASPDGMVLTDEHGVILLVNTRLEAMFGLDRADLLGRNVEHLIPDRFRNVHRAHRIRYRARPTSRAMGVALDLRARRGDGSEFPVDVSLSSLDAAGRRCIIATVRDMSERRAAEVGRLGVLKAIDAAPDGIFVFDAGSLEFRYVNEGAVAQVGYSREELTALTPLHIAPDYTEERFRDLLAPLLVGETQSVALNTVHRRRDGVDVPVEIDVKLAPPVDEDTPTLIAVARDVSDRLSREAADAERELSIRMLQDRERLAADLHDLVIQRLFAAGMGLQSIQPLVSESVVAGRLAHTVAELDQAIAELRGAIFQLTQQPEATRRDGLDRVVANASRRLGVEVPFSLEGDVDSLPTGVFEHLVAVLTEALSNVVRHADATEVSVAIAVGAGTLELFVIDNGKGMGDATFGNGMSNLRRRAAQLAGSVTVTDASPTGGTKLHWIGRVKPDVEVTTGHDG